MELKRTKRRQRRVVLVISSLVGIVVIGFLVWTSIHVLTMKETLETITTFKLPELPSVNELPSFSHGSYAVAIDGKKVNINNGSVDSGKVAPTASTAKMILALAVMQKKPFKQSERGEMLTINQEMYNSYVHYVTLGGSNTPVMIGEEISEYDALVSVLLASSNNLADNLAVWAFGSMDNYREFATKMLSDFGLTNTTIGVDACGFDESTTSTAEDLAVIGFRLMLEPVLSEIVALKNYTVPVAGAIQNTNILLGQNNIVGVKTGFIGETSGYCLVLGYKQGEHIITTAQLGFPTRQSSFDDGLVIINRLQSLIKEYELIKAGDIVGYYDSWWTGVVSIKATQNVDILGWKEAEVSSELVMDGETGHLIITVDDTKYDIEVAADEYAKNPTIGEKILHVFGWEKSNYTELLEEGSKEQDTNTHEATPEPEAPDTNIKTSADSTNCTIQLGALMLINPNFTVEESFIAQRRQELVSLSSLYGIREGVAGNGDNLLDAEAATHINDMVKAYETDNPGHTLETRSCFRARGTSCGRLCAATGASDHHTGLTCDLIDPVYGVSLDTDTYNTHIEWQWLRANSYKYGFIDRFPEAWAGGLMSEPLNVDENGSTGLFETWHFRYVGIKNATEIATGKYNDGKYDSLEHYLRKRGLVTDLKNGKCE